MQVTFCPGTCVSENPPLGIMIDTGFKQGSTLMALERRNKKVVVPLEVNWILREGTLSRVQASVSHSLFGYIIRFLLLSCESFTRVSPFSRSCRGLPYQTSEDDA